MRSRRRREAHRAANIALKEAEISLEKAQARHREVEQVVGAMRKMRERNHFIEQLEGITGAV